MLLYKVVDCLKVSPYTGEWIEILNELYSPCSVVVSPYTGEWIEIRITSKVSSLFSVSPYTGEWIEILKSLVY